MNAFNKTNRFFDYKSSNLHESKRQVKEHLMLLWRNGGSASHQPDVTTLIIVASETHVKLITRSPSLLSRSVTKIMTPNDVVTLTTGLPRNVKKPKVFDATKASNLRDRTTNTSNPVMQIRHLYQQWWKKWLRISHQSLHEAKCNEGNRDDADIPRYRNTLLRERCLNEEIHLRQPCFNKQLLC